MIIAEPSTSKNLVSKCFPSKLNVKPAFSNCSGLKSVFEKLHYRGGFVWTMGLIGEIKLRFRDGLV